jgi:RimJ/RimL family protein N-acetyltransferase
MRLQTISTDDMALYENIYCDPVMMAPLGGAFPKERIPQILRNALDYVRTGRGWVFKVIPDEDTGRAAGTVFIWKSSWRGKSINEIGWMILSPFQGRGLASKAVRAILDKARSERRWYVIHAFASTTNAPSNAICLKMGFSKIEECDFKYAGRVLRGNHWRLDLRSASPA